MFLKGFSFRVKPPSSLTAALEQDSPAKPGPKHPDQLGQSVCLYVGVYYVCIMCLYVCVYTTGCGFDPALEVFEHSHNKRRGYS